MSKLLWQAVVTSTFRNLSWLHCITRQYTSFLQDRLLIAAFKTMLPVRSRHVYQFSSARCPDDASATHVEMSCTPLLQCRSKAGEAHRHFIMDKVCIFFSLLFLIQSPQHASMMIQTLSHDGRHSDKVPHWWDGSWQGLLDWYHCVLKILLHSKRLPKEAKC